MTTRHWGEEIDRTAAQQLGLDDTFSIFMMANAVDYIDDIHGAIDIFECDFCHASEVLEEIDGRTIQIGLPKGFALVGMVPLGSDSPKHYGIVDLSSLGKA